MKLIPLDAVLAEIERLSNDYCPPESVRNALCALQNSINSLEVKEVDFDSEVNKYFKGWGNDEIHCFAMMQDGTSVGIDECIDIAKHFFELGLNSSVPMTWEDIRNIDHILDGMRNGNQVFGYPKFHEEALRRFKALKGE